MSKKEARDPKDPRKRSRVEKVAPARPIGASTPPAPKIAPAEGVRQGPSRKSPGVTQVLIRNVEDHVVDRHRSRAREKGLSLEQELREVLRAAARSSRAEFLELAAKLRATQPPGPQIDLEQIIRESRDSR